MAALLRSKAMRGPASPNGVGGASIVSVSSPWFLNPPSVGLWIVLLFGATMPLSISEVLMENKICLRM